MRMSNDFTSGLGEFSYFHIEQVCDLRASVQTVFKALINDISPWWGAPYLLDAAAKRVVLEPWPGGQLYEQWSEQALRCNREGALWGTVCEIADDELIALRGPLGLDWPAMCELRIMVEEISGSELGMAGGASATRLKLSHRALGKITAEEKERYVYGWDDLINKRLRAWVERGERLGVGHEPLPWEGMPLAPP